MFLIDTDVISESRKGERANPGVQAFFKRAVADEAPVLISVVTVGELRRGVELIRYRGDIEQSKTLEIWLSQVLSEYGDWIVEIDSDIAQLWGRLRVPHHENALDKLIAATALIYDLTVVTRNIQHFQNTGVRAFNPFV